MSYNNLVDVKVLLFADFDVCFGKKKKKKKWLVSLGLEINLLDCMD